tara:strand:- start:280 stop:954 length:675 start_codon:yes stop_codon:yes gene_type:complete
MKINKQVKGGFLGIKDACKQDERLDEMAVEYIENKNKRSNAFSGLAQGGIDDPKKALKAVMPHQKDEFDAGYQEDIARKPSCVDKDGDDVRLKIFYMLALKKAAIKKGKDGDRNYKPYFDVLFKKVDNTKKEQAMQKLRDVYKFKLEEPQPEKPQEQEGDMFTDSSSEKTDGSGGTRRNTKNLCHKKSVKKPNKCKKVKGCKVAKGTKRSYCRKAKNSTKSKKK